MAVLPATVVTVASGDRITGLLKLVWRSFVEHVHVVRHVIQTWLSVCSGNTLVDNPVCLVQISSAFPKTEFRIQRRFVGINQGLVVIGSDHLLPVTGRLFIDHIAPAVAQVQARLVEATVRRLFPGWCDLHVGMLPHESPSAKIDAGVVFAICLSMK